MKNNNRDIFDHVSEDGHPSEAAIELRRAAIRMNIVKEISADALDLAINYAWVGKAVSRTKASTKWQIQGVDPNTYEFILAMASDSSIRETAIKDALESEPARGRKPEIDNIRSLCGFQNAVENLKRTVLKARAARELARMAELCYISQCILERKKIKPKPIVLDNVVAFPVKKNEKQSK